MSARAHKTWTALLLAAAAGCGGGQAAFRPEGPADRQASAVPTELAQAEARPTEAPPAAVAPRHGWIGPDWRADRPRPRSTAATARGDVARADRGASTARGGSEPAAAVTVATAAVVDRGAAESGVAAEAASAGAAGRVTTGLAGASVGSMTDRNLRGGNFWVWAFGLLVAGTVAAVGWLVLQPPQKRWSWWHAFVTGGRGIAANPSVMDAWSRDTAREDSAEPVGDGPRGREETSRQDVEAWLSELASIDAAPRRTGSRPTPVTRPVPVDALHEKQREASG